jgi:hypothetical protein
MTITGIFNLLLASIIEPSDGVRPPKKSEELSSIRSAEPLAASTASSTEPQQTSISILDDTFNISVKHPLFSGIEQHDNRILNFLHYSKSGENSLGV